MLFEQHSTLQLILPVECSRLPEAVNKMWREFLGSVSDYTTSIPSLFQGYKQNPWVLTVKQGWFIFCPLVLWINGPQKVCFNPAQQTKTLPMCFGESRDTPFLTQLVIGRFEVCSSGLRGDFCTKWTSLSVSWLIVY